MKSNPEYASIPIMVVSSHSDINIIRDVYKYGASEFFKKPFAPEEFILKIQHQINHKESQLQYNNTTNSYLEFKNIVLHNSLYATFKKNGKVASTNKAFCDYFKNTSLSLQKIFTPYFDASIISGIINAKRSAKVYEDDISDLSGRKFHIRCFTTISNDFSDEFHIVLI